MSGLLGSIRPKAENRQPERSVDAVVPPVAIVPPVVEKSTTDCPHRQTRIVGIVEPDAFSFDPEDHHLIIDRTKPMEQFEECLWCGEFLDLIPEPETETDEEKENEIKPVEPVCNFAW